MANNDLSTNFYGFSNLEDTTASKAMILTATLPIGYISAANTAIAFGASLEPGIVITNILPALNDNAVNDLGVLTISAVNSANVATALGTITSTLATTTRPAYAVPAGGLPITLTASSYIRVFPANGIPIAGTAKVLRFAIIYKNAH
jgi:hypothetical protein